MGWKMKKYPYFSRNSKVADLPEVTHASRSAVLGNLIFLSGVLGVDGNVGESASNDIENQVIAALNNIKIALQEAGGSLNTLVKYYIFLKNAADAPRMWQAMLRYFQAEAPQVVDEPPAVSLSEVLAFERPGCLVEIDAIATVSITEAEWKMKKYPMLYNGVKQTYPYIEAGKPFFSESVAVGNLLFLSAMSAENPQTGKIDTGNFEQQMDAAFYKIKSALDNAGSSVSNIIKTLHFLTGVDNLLARSLDLKQSFSPASDRLWKRELEHYDQHAPILFDLPPASTFLKVPALPDPGAQVQLDVTAVIGRYRPGWEAKNYLLYLGKRGFPRHIGEIKKYYSNSVVVGNLAFISGQTPTDLFTARIEYDLFEEQVKVALNNLKIALEETGSSLDNMVKTNVLIPQPENLAVFRKLEKEFYRRYAPQLLVEPPVSTIIHPLSLAGTNLKIEIEAIACVPDLPK